MTLKGAVNRILNKKEFENRELERRNREQEETEKKHKEYYEKHMKEETERLNELVDWYKCKLNASPSIFFADACLSPYFFLTWR